MIKSIGEGKVETEVQSKSLWFLDGGRCTAIGMKG